MAAGCWQVLLERSCCGFALCIAAAAQLLHLCLPGTAGDSWQWALTWAVLAGDTLRAGNEGPEMCHCPCNHQRQPRVPSLS